LSHDFPALEETLSSFAVRNLMSSGLIESEQMAKCLFVRDLPNSWNLWPASSPAVQSIFRKKFGTRQFDKILRAHTLLPMYQPLGPDEITASMEKLLLNGRNRHMCRKDGLKTINIGENLESTIRYCPLCFDEQVSQHGFNWFKRDWSIPEVRRCALHQCDLTIAYCPSCENQRPLSLTISAMQGYCEKCGNDIRKVTYEHEDSGYATWLIDLLHYELPPLTVDVRKNLLGRAYRKILEIQVYERSLKSEMAKYFSEEYRINEAEIARGCLFRQRPVITKDEYESRFVTDISSRGSMVMRCFAYPLYLAYPKFETFVREAFYPGCGFSLAHR